jgi:hypothetical protein
MKQKILIITTRPVLPLDGGDKVRIFNISEQLSKYFEIDLIFIGCENQKKIISEKKIFNNIYNIPLKKLNIIYNLFKFLMSRLPLQLSFFYNKEFKRIINKEADKYDFILPHLFRSSYSLDKKFDDRVIFECCDSIGLAASRISKFNSFKKIFFKLDEKRIIKFEKSLLLRYKKNVFINQEDVNFLNLGLSNNTIVLNNGKYIEDLEINYLNNYKSNTLLFIGNMNTYPNRQAVEFVFKFLKFRKDFNLIIAGTGADYYKNRTNVTTLNSYSDLSQLNSYNIFAGVAPLFLGSGVQNKILDYLNLSIPCLTTPVGESGIDKNNPLIVFKDIDDFDIQLKLLKESFNKYKDVSEKGVPFLKKNHSWDVIGKFYKNYIIN